MKDLSTQPYILEPESDSEREENEDDKQAGMQICEIGSTANTVRIGLQVMCRAGCEGPRASSDANHTCVLALCGAPTCGCAPPNFCNSVNAASATHHLNCLTVKLFLSYVQHFHKLKSVLPLVL